MTRRQAAACALFLMALWVVGQFVYEQSDGSWMPF